MDTNKNVQYQFAGGESSVFTIGALSGTIQTNQALDYNVKNEYIFRVTTSDGFNSGTLSATATVTVKVNVRQFCFVVGKLPLAECGGKRERSKERYVW